MTTEKELNDYLESIGGLENGIFTNGKPIKDCAAFSIGKGWYGLIKNLIEELVAVGWDKNIVQVKEKFGGLRFYTGPVTKEMQDIIRKYEELSYITCEVCAEPGKVQGNPRWLSCVCEEHKYKAPEEKLENKN